MAFALSVIVLQTLLATLWVAAPICLVIMCISRHNKAICHIQDAIMLGSKGGCFTIMDATARSALPSGVSATRLPSWMLPDEPIGSLNRLRPDLLLIDGLTDLDVSTHDLADPVVLNHFQQSCIIHVLEVGYTSDASYVTTLARKHFQHVLLCSKLRAAGWRFHSSLPSSPSHILLLGTSGCIFKPCFTILTELGLLPPDIRHIMHALHLQAVSFANSIVRLRNSLIWKPP